MPVAVDDIEKTVQGHVPSPGKEVRSFGRKFLGSTIFILVATLGFFYYSNIYQDDLPEGHSSEPIANDTLKEETNSHVPQDLITKGDTVTSGDEAKRQVTVSDTNQKKPILSKKLIKQKSGSTQSTPGKTNGDSIKGVVKEPLFTGNSLIKRDPSDSINEILKKIGAQVHTYSSKDSKVSSSSESAIEFKIYSDSTARNPSNSSVFTHELPDFVNFLAKTEMERLGFQFLNDSLKYLIGVENEMLGEMTMKMIGRSSQSYLRRHLPPEDVVDSLMMKPYPICVTDGNGSLISFGESAFSIIENGLDVDELVPVALKETLESDWMNRLIFWYPTSEGVLTDEEPKTASMDSIVTKVQSVSVKPSVRIFPNPTANFFTLEFETESTHKVQISISNLNGVLVKNLLSAEQHKGGAFSKKFEVSDLRPGLYIVTVLISGHGQLSKRLLISR